MVNSALIGGMCVGAGLAVLLAGIFRRAMKAPSVGVPKPEWVTEFSVSRYRPMSRLLDESEFEFLSSQPGFRKELAAKLRTERRRILRQYLRLARRDFDRLYAVANMMLVHSAQDRSEMSAALLRRRITFIYAFTAIQVRLALHQAGGSIDLIGLTNSLDAFRLQVQQMAPAAGAA